MNGEVRQRNKRSYFIISVLLALFIIITLGNKAFAQDENTEFSEEVIHKIILMQNEYSDWEDCILVDLGDIQCDAEFGHVVLYGVVDTTDENRGYVIYSVTNDLIMEYSKNVNPYDSAVDNYSITGEYERIYSYGNYAIATDDSYLFLDGAGCLMDSVETSGISGMSNLNGGGENGINTLVSGTIDPQLQGSYNCIVIAISNLIWYYGHNGYSSLIQTHTTFTSVKYTVMGIMNSLGGFTNSNIPSTLSSYMGSTLSSAVNDWSPSVSKMVTEINADRPFLLGFAAGSTIFSYSTTVGHMTMCVGYTTAGTISYSIVVDGHSTNTVTKMWTSYNDFMCKVYMN